MSSTPQQNEKALSDICLSRQNSLNNESDYYLLITPTTPYNQQFVNNNNAVTMMERLIQDFNSLRKAVTFNTISTKEIEFAKTLANSIPPVGITAGTTWHDRAKNFCEEFASTIQPTNSIVIGYWDEFQQFANKAGNNLKINKGNQYCSFANTSVKVLPLPGQNFSIAGSNSIHDILYPPFDISMATLLNSQNIVNQQQFFLKSLRALQIFLRQAAIAILEIGKQSAQMHIINLRGQKKGWFHKKTLLRLHQMTLPSGPQQQSPTKTVIESIVNGRCFTGNTRSSPSDCVVPYGLPMKPLINRPESYHKHLADGNNRDKGIGATWLPGDVLAVAEGRWLWDIAFPYNNRNENQNEIIHVPPSLSLQQVLATKTVVRTLVFKAQARATTPPFCHPTPVNPTNWDQFLTDL
jgi:hypothetical protein